MLTKIPPVIPEFCKDCEFFDPSKYLDETKGYCNFYFRQRELLDPCLAAEARPASASPRPKSIPEPVVNADFRQEDCPQAKTALILAIVSLFCCGIILGPVALFKAMEAQSMIDRNPHLRGAELVKIAKILATIAIILWLVSLVMQIVGLITGC